jgi:hypothetical protein
MAKSFSLVDGELYKCAASGIWQRCIPIPKGRELLRDIRAGICGHHAAPRMKRPEFPRTETRLSAPP